MSGSLIEFGMGATSLALLLAVLAVILALASVRMSKPGFAQVARRALVANFALVTIGCTTIIWSFVQNDFSVAYVAQNSNTQLPLIYRLTALWGAHEGSLLLWMWVLSLHSAIVAWPPISTSLLQTSHTSGARMPLLAVNWHRASPFTRKLQTGKARHWRSICSVGRRLPWARQPRRT